VDRSQYTRIRQPSQATFLLALTVAAVVVVVAVLTLAILLTGGPPK